MPRKWKILFENEPCTSSAATPGVEHRVRWEQFGMQPAG